MAELQIRDRERDRQIIKWYYSGLNYEMIAKKLNVTKGRVGQLYRRIMKESDQMNSSRRIA